MSEPCTGHGAYLSGIFEIEEKLSQEQLYKAEFRTYSVSIACSGANRKQDLTYEIQATGFSSPMFKLEPSNICFLRGSFFPTNTNDTYNDELFFEGSDRVTIGSAETFSVGLDDTVGITSIGRVLSVELKVEQAMQYLKRNTTDPDLSTMYVIVQHCDFHPQTKLARSFTIEYRIPPFKHLLGSPQVVKEGRECQFHGYIKDFNEVTMRYVAVVNKVAPTSGHVEVAPGSKSSQEGKQSTPAARPKSKKFSSRAVSSPFKSPLIASGSGSSTPFGPSESTPSSAESAPSASAKDLLPSPPGTQPPKKRTRAGPKRKATKDIVVPDSEEY